MHQSHAIRGEGGGLLACPATQGGCGGPPNCLVQRTLEHSVHLRGAEFAAGGEGGVRAGVPATEGVHGQGGECTAVLAGQGNWGVHAAAHWRSGWATWAVSEAAGGDATEQQAYCTATVISHTLQRQLEGKETCDFFNSAPCSISKPGLFAAEGVAGQVEIASPGWRAALLFIRQLSAAAAAALRRSLSSSQQRNQGLATTSQ